MLAVWVRDGGVRGSDPAAVLALRAACVGCSEFTAIADGDSVSAVVFFEIGVVGVAEAIWWRGVASSDPFAAACASASVATADFVVSLTVFAA